VLRVALAHLDQAVIGIDAGAHAGLADVQRFVGSSGVQELQRVIAGPPPSGTPTGKLDVWGNHATKQ
jgi:hypothetical protein